MIDSPRPDDAPARGLPFVAAAITSCRRQGADLRVQLLREPGDVVLGRSGTHRAGCLSKRSKNAIRVS